MTKDMGGASERDLILWAKDGDRQAFDELKKRHGPRIRGYIFTRTWTDTDADDIEAETWIMTWQRMHAYDPVRPDALPLISWVKLMASRCLADYYRCSEHEVQWQMDDCSSVASRENDADRDIWTRDELLPRCFSDEMGYPWQLLAFGLLYGKEWTRKEVEGRFSGSRLDLVLGEVMRETQNAFYLDDPSLMKCFEPLQRRMAMPVCRHVREEDSVTRRLVAAFGQDETGQTVLRKYFVTRDPRNTLSDWKYKVKTRILTFYKEHPELMYMPSSEM